MTASERPLAVYVGIDDSEAGRAASALRESGFDVVHVTGTHPTGLGAVAGTATALLLANATVDAELLGVLPNLKVVALVTQGHDGVDLGACRRAGVQVAHVPPVAAEELAVHAWTLALCLIRGLHLTSLGARLPNHIRPGEGWRQPPSGVVPRLSELTVGIIGTGASAEHLVRQARGTAARVLAFSRSGRTLDGASMTPDLNSLLQASDVVSLHVPLTPETSRMVDADFLATMKRGSILINIARGGLVDSAALADALDAGHLSGAGLDVLDEEPPPPDHPLLGRPEVLITPHVAWFSTEAEQRYLDEQAANVVTWLKTGHVAHPVA